MGKLFVLIGESGSGKTTIEREIQKLGLARRIISCSTRKPRSYEMNHVDYHFIDELVFKLYQEQGMFAEVTEYTTVDGKAWYGSMKADIKLDEGDYICVLNPDGYRQVVKSLGRNNVIGIHIYRAEKDRFISALNRDDSDFRKVLKEANRRLDSDTIDFKDIDLEVDYIVDNNRELYLVIQDVESIILNYGKLIERC